MLNGVDQNMINTVVDGVLSNTLTLEQETEYINLSTPYDDLYNENNFNMHNWIQNGDQFPINDLCDWDSYLDEGWLLDSGFTESCLSHWSLGKTPTIKEYKKLVTKAGAILMEGEGNSGLQENFPYIIMVSKKDEGSSGMMEFKIKDFVAQPTNPSKYVTDIKRVIE